MYSLSVIVPTHERAEYARVCIEALLSISGDIEIIVSDTSQTDKISQFFTKQITSGTVKYYRHEEKLNVVENYEFGYRVSTGDYLLSIGDDDIVTDQITKAISLMYNKNIDVLKINFSIEYYWEDFGHKRLGGGLSDVLRHKNFSGNLKKINAEKIHEKALKRLGHGVLDMPRAYLGIISRSLYNKIMMDNGSLFGGVSPDIYSASLIALTAENPYEIDIPLIIPGATAKSTSGQSANGGHLGKLRENAHIGAFKDLEWDDYIPEFYSVPTVWAFSLVESLKENSNVNFLTLYLHCFIFHKNYRSYIYSSFNTYVKNNSKRKIIKDTIQAFCYEGVWFYERLKGKLFGNKFENIINAGGLIKAKSIAEKLINSRVSIDEL